MAFELVAVVAALALGFVLGRIWEMRREIRRELEARVMGRIGVASPARDHDGAMVEYASQAGPKRT